MAKILIHKKRKETIEGKERVISKFKKYYVADLTRDFHCNEGVLKKNAFKKKQAKTNMGFTFSIFDAQFCDEYWRMTRGPQTIPLKDIGVIIAITGLNKNSIVVDAGTGSGALAIALANLVKEVHTYDILDEHLRIAKENIEKMKIKNCFIKKHDVTKSIPQKKVDVLILDLPDPYLVVKHAMKVLTSGGWFISYSPHVTQVVDFCKEVEKQEDLFIVKTIELIEREWDIEDRKARPKTQGIGHSGFLTFVRKIG